MKKVTFFAFFMVWFAILNMPGTHAQDSVSIKAYREVLERIDSANYTRIPNKDFDRVLTYQVNNSINSKLTFWLTITGAIVAIIGGLALYSAKRFVSDNIREVIQEKIGTLQRELFNKNDEQIKGIQEKISTVQRELYNKNDEQIKGIRQELQKDLERVNGEIKIMNQTSLSTQKFIYGEEFEKIKAEVDANAPRDQIYNRLKTLLNEIEKIGYREILPNVVDELIAACYILRKYKDIDLLIEAYGFKDEELLGNSYFTAGLVGLNNYNLYSSAAGRSSAIRFMDKSLELTPGYGTAQAVKLEIFMMDYERATSEKDKQKAKDEAIRVLAEVNTSIFSPWETIERLNGDRKVKSFVKFVNLLYELFPGEMAIMEEKALQGREINQEATQGSDKEKLSELLNKYITSAGKGGPES